MKVTQSLCVSFSQLLDGENRWCYLPQRVAGMWLNYSVSAKHSMSDTFDMLHTVFYYYYFNKITMATIRKIQSGKRPTGTGPFRSNCNHADEKLGPFSAQCTADTVASFLFSPYQAHSYLHPLYSKFLLPRMSLLPALCKAVFSSLSIQLIYSLFRETLPEHTGWNITCSWSFTNIYQSIFLIFYRSHYYLKCSLVSICSFSFASTRV